MKHKTLITCAAIFAASIFFLESSHCFWVWTPGSKKFVNPKYAVKDSPREQFKWAMGFYDSADYARAAAEFEKLLKHYEFSEEAAEAQYYTGLSYENQSKYYIAFQNYQKIFENYPHSKRLDEVIERQFNIGNVYLTKINSKLLGSELMAPLDRAQEIFKNVVENAPYGPFADKAQFKLGEAYKKAGLFDEAVLAFKRLVDEYPSSPLIANAKYEIASCAYQASLKPAYDVAPSEGAIAAFKEFVETNKDEELAKEAEDTLMRLEESMAEKVFSTAKFYEARKRYTSAIVYYKEVVEKYPRSAFASAAAEKIDTLEKHAGGGK